MWILQSCLKRALCSLLGVNSIARNDVIEGITNFPRMTTRCKMLRTRRAEKLQSLWADDNRLDHALVFVLHGINGPNLAIDLDLLPIQPVAHIRVNDHFTPVTASRFTVTLVPQLVVITPADPDKTVKIRSSNNVSQTMDLYLSAVRIA